MCFVNWMWCRTVINGDYMDADIFWMRVFLKQFLTEEVYLNL